MQDDELELDAERDAVTVVGRLVFLVPVIALLGRRVGLADAGGVAVERQLGLHVVFAVLVAEPGRRQQWFSGVYRLRRRAGGPGAGRHAAAAGMADPPERKQRVHVEPQRVVGRLARGRPRHRLQWRTGRRGQPRHHHVEPAGR